MKLTILGSGTSLPTKKRGAPGYFLEIKKKKVLLDCGSGITRQMVLANKKYWDIDYIFITHIHPDHITDLGYLLHGIHVRSYYMGHKRNKKLEIFGPPGFKKSYEYQRKSVAFPVGRELYQVKIIEISRKKLKFPGFNLESTVVKHVPNLTSLAFRFRETGGKTFVFGGDTDVCPEIYKIAKSADVLLMPASLPEHQKMIGHVIPSESGQIAQKARVKKLYLTHFYPIAEKFDAKKYVKKYYKGPVVIAKDLMKFTI